MFEPNEQNTPLRGVRLFGVGVSVIGFRMCKSSKLNLTISPTIEIRDGVPIVHGQPLSTYCLFEEIPDGKNGRVFLGEHEWNGPCVLKMWLREGVDWQDRWTRGLEEVIQTARANKDWSVEMIEARPIKDVFLASMKYVEGQTLREALKGTPSDLRRWELAAGYIAAIAATRDTPHGDAHPGNVIIQEPADSGDLPKSTLLDFASTRVGRRSREERHVDVFRDTLRDIVRQLPKFTDDDQSVLDRIGEPGDLDRIWEMMARLKPET